MKNYILSITITSILSAFVYIASPCETRKYVSILVSLILIGVIVSPVSKDFDLNFNLTFEDVETNIKNEDTNKMAAESLAKSLSQTLKNEFDIKAIAVDINLKDNSTFDVIDVVIYVSKPINDKGVIEEKLQNLYNCKILITTS